jgi:hypothetical protein
MNRATKTLLAAAGGALALWTAWGVYSQNSADRVPYTLRQTLDGIEIRDYPETVLVETTAPSANSAFRRLFQYISGENERQIEVEMTAPVRTQGEQIAMTTPVRTSSEKIAMTVPVRMTGDSGETTMGFYLPSEYTGDTAPKPTNPEVSLTVEPPRTLAVRPFSWYATPGRTERYERELMKTLVTNDIKAVDEPVLLQYNDPWTPPFMRTNEVAVEVEL